MEYPYVFVSSNATVQEPVAFDNVAGLRYKPIQGTHAIWAARVPFLPAMLSADFTRLGKERTGFVRERQFRFIYDLARARDHNATFELRFISTPNPVPGQPNLIDIVFFGKVFASQPRSGELDPTRVRDFAIRLWENFASIFPSEDPFNYPLQPVGDPELFRRYHEPFPFPPLCARNVLEIRKYEDMPIRSAAPLARVERKGDYIAHPFVPNVDFTPMNRFFAALAVQPQRCYAAMCIRPTRMFDQEIFNVSFGIAQFKRTASAEDDVTEEYIRSRSKIGTYVYQQLMEEREQLVQVRVHLVGETTAPYALAEALGSEMMGNANNEYPTQWVAAQPADDVEFRAALDNLRFLEHNYWGHSIAAPPLIRLRYLATAREAYGAFRLPVPPESSYVPGVLVKSEPFVAPADALLVHEEQDAIRRLGNTAADTTESPEISLGTVFHRGSPTRQAFSVKVSDLTRHTLIAGSTGSGKSTTVKHMLGQLWEKHRIPFLVLYPISKADYRDLRTMSGLQQDLLVFTLGDEGTSPLRFNPFEVPDGLLLKTHLSRLMRVFTAAFTLQDPLPMIYREALRRMYRLHGWDPIVDRGQPGHDYPIMSEFYSTIRQLADSLEYGREVKDTVRQASVIRIADLLENAGHVVNVRNSMSLPIIMSRPVVMEIGSVGSAQDTNLLMGFLLMRFAEEVERHPRPPDRPHITVVEEAHRLMAESAPSLPGTSDARGAAGEDFSNILAEVRGFGEGLIIAEQMPSMLVRGAVGNTNLKIMHWLEDASSFELFANAMNLNEEQREYVRALSTGFAIVRSPYGRPVHIKIPDPTQTQVQTPAIDNTDAGIHRFMEHQRRQCGLDDVAIVPWEASLSTADAGKTEKQPSDDILRLLLAAPMQTCAYCAPLHRTRRCLYGQMVRQAVLSDTRTATRVGDQFRQALSEEESTARWNQIRAIDSEIEPHLVNLQAGERAEAAYCLAAHLTAEIVSEERASPPQGLALAGRARGALRGFQSSYARESPRG